MEKVHENKVSDKVKVKLFQRHKFYPYYIGFYSIKVIIWNTVKLQEDRSGTILKKKRKKTFTLRIFYLIENKVKSNIITKKKK